MASRTVYPTSKEVSFPVHAKTMLLKNWKDHCQTKHSMILSEENLKKEYEKLKQATVSSPSSSKTATDVLSTNTLFSMKNLSLTKHSQTTSIFNDNDSASIIISINNYDSINIAAIQNPDNNLIADVSSSTDCQTILPIQIESLDTEMIHYESNNEDVRLFTPTVVNVLQGVDTDTLCHPVFFSLTLILGIIFDID